CGGAGRPLGDQPEDGLMSGLRIEVDVEPRHRQRQPEPPAPSVGFSYRCTHWLRRLCVSFWTDFIAFRLASPAATMSRMSRMVWHSRGGAHKPPTQAARAPPRTKTK